MQRSKVRFFCVGSEVMLEFSDIVQGSLLEVPVSGQPLLLALACLDKEAANLRTAPGHFSLLIVWPEQNIRCQIKCHTSHVHITCTHQVSIYIKCHHH